MKLASRIILAGLSLLLLFSLGACADKEPDKIKIGTQPWIGYGPWWIAEELGLYEKHGLEVELVIFSEDKEVNAALASGDMQGANCGNYQAVKLFSSGLDIRIILVEDVSYEADAILASTEIKSVQDLNGKKVAYEEGTVGDVLINYALVQNGLTLQDIKPIFMPAADAGVSVIAGAVDAGVTYEPYVSEALADSENVHVIYTAAERPGIISDVFVVSTMFLEENPEAARTLLLIWEEAMAYYKSDPEEAKKIVAKAMDSSYEELKDSFDGIDLYDLADNRQYLTGEFKTILIEGAQIAQAIGLLDEIPDLDEFVDAGYLGE